MAGADLTPSPGSASSSPTHIASSAAASGAVACKFRALLEPQPEASAGAGRVHSAALREAALSGVPACVRADVWTRLLSLTPRDYAARREALDTHAVAVRSVCAALRRARVVRPPVPPISDDAFALATTNSKSRRLVLPSAEHVLKFIGVIGVYLESAGSDVEFHTDMVYLAAVFIEVMPTEADAHNAFSAVMRAQRPMYTSDGIRRAVTELAAGLRYLYSDLHEAFVSEEVDINLWAPSWLRSMLARQLPRDAVLRLWDALFAKHQRDWSLLHPYICLALLGEMRADLQDCEDSERILALLSRPRVGDAADPARIITSANAIREKLKSAGVI